MTTDQTIETEIVAKGLTAPRVTPADIEANIAEEHSFTADVGFDALRFQWLTADHANADERQAAREVLDRMSVMSTSAARLAVDAAMGRDGNGWSESLGLLTFCVLVLRNGTKIAGINYGAIDPAQHSAEQGRIEARAHAIDQVWPLMGYALRERLSVSAVEPKVKKPYTWDDVATYENWANKSTLDTEFQIRTKGDNGVYMVTVPYGTDGGAVQHVVMQECTRQRDSLTGEA